MNWRDHLQARLLEIQPESVCAARCRPPATGRQRAAKHARFPAWKSTGADLCAGTGTRCAERAGRAASPAPDQPDAPLCRAAHSACRATGCALDDETFRALGFTLSATDTAENLRIYDYDLATYKTVPDWLNARYWAHPERWEP